MKTIKRLVCFVFISVLILSAIPFNAENEAADETDYVTFIATGNDPYASYEFSKSGAHDKIDPDTVKWAAIRYQTITKSDSLGNDLKGQFYITPAAEPCVPIYWNHTEKWETIVVDLTSTMAETTLDSIWSSVKYTATGTVRFDPMESNRDPELNDSSDPCVVEKDSSINIAWIAFFDNEEAANAYTGKEDTPYCIITPDELVKASGNRLTAKRVQGGQEVATPTPEPKPDLFSFYNTSASTNTGWWNNGPYKTDMEVLIGAEIPKWFDGVYYFSLCSTLPVDIGIQIRTEDDEVVAEGKSKDSGNAMRFVELDKKVAPGYYYVAIMCLELEGVDEESYGSYHFVLGSGSASDDVDPEDIEFSAIGFNTNNNTGDAPAVALRLCEADPDYTAKPTATPKPTAIPTEVPATEAPATEAPATDAPATEVPKDNTKDNTNDSEKSGSNTGAIIAVIAAVVVVAAVAVVIIVKKKKG